MTAPNPLRRGLSVARRPSGGVSSLRGSSRARSGFVTGFLVLSIGLLLGGCISSLARLPHEPSYAIAVPADGILKRFSDRLGAELPVSESAYWLLDRNDEALSARLAIADSAVSTLDVQYFIWQPDESGRLLLERLIKAADRGVRVRVLLDDFAVNGLDPELVALDAHPHIEVKVFNPWHHRKWRIIKAAEFFLRIGDLNHRMHNKVFVADNRFGIVGGRNIGNRYFGLDEIFVQNDLDLMAAGPLVEEMSASFDLFWNSGAAYPARALLPGRDGSRLYTEFVAEVDGDVRAGATLLGSFPLQPVNWGGYLERLMTSYSHGEAELQFDLPSVSSTPPEQLYADFREYLTTARSEVLISSPYFIPDQAFIDELAELVARGVRVAIVTNSLASNNHAVAHTGYKHWRRAVLKIGVELYELRPDAATKNLYATPPVTVQTLGLHSKAVVIDRQSVFIGSPNIDPRSMRLNTELGAILEDPELAGEVGELLDRDMESENSWQVTLRKGRWLTWTSNEGVLRRQPAAGFRQRSVEFFLNLLPFKGQL
jgi:cardiolipin synthase C